MSVQTDKDDNSSMGDMELSTGIQILILILTVHELNARNCICVHDGLVLPVDQHPTVTELSGGTCVEVLKDHIHFKNVNWTLVLFQGHHAFVEKIRSGYDKVKCDSNNVPIPTTTTTLPSTTQTTTPLPSTTALPTTPTTMTSTDTTSLPSIGTTQTSTDPTPLPSIGTTWTSTDPTLPPSIGTTARPSIYCPPKTGTYRNSAFTCANLAFVTREDWGVSTQYTYLNDLTKQFSCNVDFVIVHQTLGDICTSTSTCINRLQNDIQYWKQRQYNFAIGNDGTVFELNGFHSVGKHTTFFDNISLGIAYIGDYTSVRPSEKAIDSLKSLLECAVQQRLLSPSYVIRNERDILGTGLGDALYNEIQQLPHY